jgi:hypothetical protein
MLLRAEISSVATGTVTPDQDDREYKTPMEKMGYAVIKLAASMLLRLRACRMAAGLP